MWNDGAPMTAKGFVEGRRPGTPPAKITDGQIRDEDARLQTQAARACRAHLADLVRAHDHSAALRKLDAALHELRTVEDQARFLAGLFRCEVKDVWETVHFAAHDRRIAR